MAVFLFKFYFCQLVFNISGYQFFIRKQKIKNVDKYLSGKLIKFE